MRMLMLKLQVVALLTIAACGGDHPDVECTDDHTCSLDLLEGGSCDTFGPTGKHWCSYDDALCSSGRRWSRLAGDDLASVCVAVAMDAGVDAPPAPWDAGPRDAGPDAPADGGSADPVDRDLNGDGLADIVIGAPYAGVGGRAYVYFGRAAGGFADLPNGTLSGVDSSESFGWSVAVAGDLNGDGFADLAVGANGDDTSFDGAGAVFVYFGGSGETFDATPDRTLTGMAQYDNFGTSVAGAGDVNDDGFADLLVGATGNDAGGASAGRAYVYLGGEEGPDYVAASEITGAAGGDFLGLSVATAGDVNGDGFDDIVVGALQNDAGGTNAGRAYVYLGNAEGVGANPSGTLTGAAAEDKLGFSVASAGDVDDDGFDDVIVGAPGNDAIGAGAGRAYVYFGGAGDIFDPLADDTVSGGAAGDSFGVSVGRAGDVNGDGFHDLVVGASFNSSGGTMAGRAYIYLGGANGVSAAPDTTLTSSVAGANFGQAVASAGDVNGDGFADVIVGAPGNDRAFLYLGGVGAFSATSDDTLVGEKSDDNFGVSVSSTGK